MDVERERRLAVHHHHGDALAVRILQLVVARDVDLVQLERSLFAHLADDAPGRGAEMTFGCVVQKNAMGRARGYWSPPLLARRLARTPLAAWSCLSARAVPRFA